MQRSIPISLLCLGAFSFACSDSGTTPPPANDPIEFETSSLPEGQQGVSYSAEIFAKGGSGEDYRWSVIGSLPAGLFMSSKGMVLDDGRATTTILGTPQVNGEYSFSVRLTDDEGDFETIDLSVTLQPPPPALSIVTETLPDGGTESVYSAQLEASNGVAPVRWSLTAGALPPGITLAESGELSGTPADAGEFAFEVRVSDAEAKFATANYTIKVQDESLPLAMVTTDLPDGVVDLAFTASIEAENGSPPYSWQIIGDAPPGLTIEAEGNPVALAGTPTANGSYTFQIEVEDSAGIRVRRTFFVEITRAPPPVRITTLNLPGGEVNTPYSATLSGVNGSGSGYTWQISQGALPAGLTLAAMGTPDTTISGTPTQSGDFAFTVEIRDDAGRVHEADFTINVIAEIFPIQITTTSTLPGPNLTLPSTRLGEAYQYTLTAEEGFGQYNWVVSEGRLPAGLVLEVAGTPSSRIIGLAGERGTFTATVTVYDSNNVTDSVVVELTVNGPEFPVNITTPTVPDALTCNAYVVDVVAQQGSNVDYQWSVVGGSLPPGITLDPTGTPASKLRGTVIAGTSGTFNFTVQVQDSAGDVFTQDLSIAVTDDGTGDRWVAFVGDMAVDNRFDVMLSNVCQATPSAAMVVTPGTTGDADTSGADFALSPDGTKVAFTGDFRVVGFDEVWIVDLTGAQPAAPVIVSPATANTTSFDAFDLKWANSSDGLAFMGDFNVNGVNELYFVDVSTGIVANSAIPVAPTPPSYADVDALDYEFSWDGRFLAYTHDTEASGAYDLWVFDRQVGTARSARQVNQPLPSTGADVAYPFVWSPDSTSIMYHCDCEVASQDELYLANVTGATITTRKLNRSLITNEDVRSTTVEYQPRYFGFTRDGMYGYYTSGDFSVQGDTLFSVDLSNPTAVGVPVHTSITNPNQDLRYPRLATGTQVVMQGDAAIDNVSELFMFDLAGPFPQPIAAARVSGTMQPGGDVGSYLDFEVSEDGTKLVFTADRITEGHDAAFFQDLVNPMPEPIQLSPESITDPNLDLFGLVISPDGNRVAFYGDMRLNGVNEVWGASLLPPYEWQQLGPQFPSSSDVNVSFTSNFTPPLLWRGDGGGVIFEADIGASSRDEPYYVDWNDPGVAVRLAPNIPANGDNTFMVGQRPRWQR